MEDLIKDIKHLDRACDAMAQVCFELDKCEDWVGKAQLRHLEGMLDDLGERVSSLRDIRDTVNRMQEERDGTTGC